MSSMMIGDEEVVVWLILVGDKIHGNVCVVPANACVFDFSIHFTIDADQIPKFYKLQKTWF